MMHIVHVIEPLGGGTLVSVSQLCNIAADAGYKVTLLYGEARSELPYDFAKFFCPDVKLIAMPGIRKLSLVHDVAMAKFLRSFFKNEKANFVHLHCAKAGFLGRLLLIRRRGVKVFYSPRGFSFYSGKPLKNFFYKCLERVAHASCGRIIACSKEEYEQAIATFGGDKIDLLRNAVDYTQYGKNGVFVRPRQLNVGASKFLVVASGRLAFQKNPELFAEIAKDFSGLKYKFLWVGGGDQGLASKLESAGVEVTGWLSREDAINLINSADVFVLPSRYEGLPISLIEAQQLGIPSVVSNCIGNVDVINITDGGFVCRTKNDYVRVIKRLAMEAELYQLVSKKAYSVSRDYFGIERLRSEYLELLGR